MPRKDPDARREYNREYQRRWYKENRELHMQRVLKVNRRRRELGKDFVDDLKCVPCADCGVKYPPYVMDFDHVRGEKQLNLSRLRNSRLAWAKLVAEIEKCEVVCANCHRMRTRLRSEGGEVMPSDAAQWLALGYVVIPVR
jgi:ferredoxin